MSCSERLPPDDPVMIYIKEAENVPPLNAEERQELAESIANGDKTAVRRLTEANLRLVVRIAEKYTDSGVPLSDLIQAGNIGLIKAAEKYGGTDSGDFPSQAAWMIRQAVCTEIGRKTHRDTGTI